MHRPPLLSLGYAAVTSLLNDGNGFAARVRPETIMHIRVALVLAIFAATASSDAQLPPSAAPPSSRYVEKLTGVAARRHAENISARRGDLFQRAAAVLRERGWRDTGRIEVHRTNRQIAGKSGAFNPAYPRLQSPGSSSEEGEIVTWEWDDGNYDTWEGTVYLHEYDSGTWMAVDAQFWLMDGNEWQEIWSYVVDGQSSPNYPPETETLVSETRTPLLIASLVTEVSISTVDIPYIYLVQENMRRVRQKWASWGSCTAFGCAGALYACNRQNPTPQEKPDVAICAAAWCIAAGINCLGNLR